MLFFILVVYRYKQQRRNPQEQKPYTYEKLSQYCQDLHVILLFARVKDLCNNAELIFLILHLTRGWEKIQSGFFC